MMNHHMPAGPGQSRLSPVLPMHPIRGRQQEYHQYHHHQHQPLHTPQYQGYHHPQTYYPHQSPYQQQRWHPQYSPQHFISPQQMQPQYQPRSPMVVTSQPHAPMTPVTRQAHTPVAPQPLQNTHSPRPISNNVQQATILASPSPDATVTTTAATATSTASRPDERAESPGHVTQRPLTAPNPLSLPAEYKDQYWPQLPWYSVPEDKAIFRSRAGQLRRKRRNLCAPAYAIALPKRDEIQEDLTVHTQIPRDAVTSTIQETVERDHTSFAKSTPEPPSEDSTVAAPSEPETPATSLVPSEAEFAQISTPTSLAQASTTSPKPTTPTQHAHSRRDTRTAIAVPNLPNLPRAKETVSAPGQTLEATSTAEQVPKPNGIQNIQNTTEGATQESETSQAPQDPPETPAPKSWADLLRRNANGAPVSILAEGTPRTNGVQLPKSASLADALRQYSVQNNTTLSFLEPRGLVNTGNMCYMNSILQVLVFCAPFYSFLEQVRQRTVHSMKSDTPLLDAMIMFMREFKVLASADSLDALCKMLKQDQLELYGDPVTPEYVYDVIRKLPRFASMRRGHQQDAEEFLGFLLEGLHDESVYVMQGQPEESMNEKDITSPVSVTSPGSADGWLEVGPKQKASVTRTAGQQDAPSPVTKIFGGHLRSELRVPGSKDSVTLEPYKPLQLDIGAQNVNNIIDAMKGLTKTEALTGDFGGRGNVAKKQVFIDTLPPVLILHLKRFQYDNNLTGTQKIWKKVGYPLELEIPKDVFTPSKRGGLAVHGGLPKYRLISVVYHHGKSAAGGHYTVDVLRQDGREWVRMDDTNIRRIRPEDVAEGGAEEDPKILARALEQHRADQELQKQRNMYQGLDEDAEEEKPWSEVNGGLNSHVKKWSGIAAAAAGTNGTATPSSASGKRTPIARKEAIRDNKVAYILLYERIRV